MYTNQLYALICSHSSISQRKRPMVIFQPHPEPPPPRQAEPEIYPSWCSFNLRLQWPLACNKQLSSLLARVQVPHQQVEI